MTGYFRHLLLIVGKISSIASFLADLLSYFFMVDKLHSFEGDVLPPFWSQPGKKYREDCFFFSFLINFLYRQEKKLK